MTQIAPGRREAEGSALHTDSAFSWLMAFAGFVCVMCTYGAVTGSLPLIYGQVIDEFGWSRTSAVSIVALKNLFSAITSIFLVGFAINRFGLKAVMITAGVITALGMASFSWIGSLYSYYFAGALIGIGVMPVMITCQVLVSRWFTRNQGLAVAIVASGVSAGGIIFPFVSSYLIEQIGWRLAFVVISTGIWAIALPLFVFLVKDKPDGAKVARQESQRKAQEAEKARLDAADLDESFSDVLKTPGFWIVISGLFLVSAADSAVLQHTYLFLERELNLSAGAAAMGLSSIFGLGIFAKLLAGKFYDLFSIRGVSVWYLLIAISIFLALQINGAGWLAAFAIARGIAHGGFVIVAPVVAKHCYGPRLINNVMPVYMGAFAVGNALGPTIMSAIYDSAGSYNLGFGLSAAVCVVSAASLLLVRPKYWDRVRAGEHGQLSKESSS